MPIHDTELYRLHDLKFPLFPAIAPGDGMRLLLQFKPRLKSCRPAILPLKRGDGPFQFGERLGPEGMQDLCNINTNRC
jgi:hypothetical protein